MPYRFFPEQLVELTSRLLSLLVIAFNLALFPILLEQSQKVEDLAIGGDVDDAVGRRLPYEILSVKIVRIVLGKFLLHVLHKLNEFIEGYVFNILVHTFTLSYLRE